MLKIVTARWARRVTGAAVAAGLGGMTLAAGQPLESPVPEADPADEIIVTGSKPVPEEIRRRAIDFIRQTGVATGERPVARWADPVCPRAFGLSETYSKIVEAKLRTIADAARVPVAREPCRPNIGVSFAANAGTFVRRIAARSPRRLAEVSASEREALMDGSAPIRWWYATELRTKDGMPGTGVPSPWAGGNAEGGGSVIPDNGKSVSLLQYSSSIVSTQAVRALTSAMVVVDVNRAEGVPLDAVASYAALVAFAEIKPGASLAPGSILGLFDGDSGPQALTKWDMTFLRELYRLPLDRKARQQRGHLVRALVAAETGQ